MPIDDMPSTTARWQVRAAVAADADAIARVHHASWVETYTGLVPEEFWQRGTLETRQRMWTAVLGTTDQPHDLRGAVALVAEIVPDDAAGAPAIVGFALAGPAQAEDTDDAAGSEASPVLERELSALYVLAAHHGTGMGQALMDAALPPTASARLGVAEDNPRARAFYARNGFVPDGARRTLEWFGGLTEITLVRPKS